MQRNLSTFQSARYDILVIGGGIYGACIARDAALRGLHVALLECGDFGNATSHNSLKLIHGGLRYLQHLDFVRVRQSVRERRIWLGMAPHLVHPLKCVIPTIGHGTRGPEALWCGLKLYEVLSFDRNRGMPSERWIPKGGVLSRKQLLELIPGLDADDISGGAFWYDAQAIDTDRLLIEVVQGAVDAGAEVANYLAVNDFLHDNGRVSGVRATDKLLGEELEIHARMTINAAGPWISKLVSKALNGRKSAYTSGLTRGMNLVTRSLDADYAFGVPSARTSDAVLGSSKRLFFITPLDGCTMIGTSHLPYSGNPDDCTYTENDAQAFLQEINAAYPSAHLTMNDVRYWYGGLTPAEEDSGQGEVKRSRQSELFDHARQDGLDGLISVNGVKYTTARLSAEKAVDLAIRKLGRQPLTCLSGVTPLPGARNAPATGYQQKGHASRDLQLYGCNADRIQALMEPGSAPDHEAVFKARCRYAIDQEMAVRLQDVVLRRTSLAQQGKFTEGMLDWCATTMAQQLQWSDDRKQRELEDTREQLQRHGARLQPEAGEG